MAKLPLLPQVGLVRHSRRSSPSLSQAVGRFYDNYEGLLDSFAAFWGVVAERFAGNEHVLGYEIINEPWCGDVYEDPTLLLPGVADRCHLLFCSYRSNM